MITGVVNDREARIPLSLRGPQQREQDIEAVVDTGYTASLSLPPAQIAVLGLNSARYWPWDLCRRQRVPV